MPQKILIVDDYPEYALMLQKKLSDEGFEAALASDGQMALDMAKSEKPDLIILDIMMPHIGGTEVRMELKKDPDTQRIPVIFLTGLKAPHSKKRSKHADVRVIGKSSDFAELLDAVREELSKS